MKSGLINVYDCYKYNDKIIKNAVENTITVI